MWGGGIFEVIGLSPNFIPNLSWYKDMDFSYTQNILENLYCKQHMLLSLDFQSVWERDNSFLSKKLKEFRKKIATLRKEGSSEERIGELINILQDIQSMTLDFGENFLCCIQECVELLYSYKDLTPEKISDLEYLSNSWGRGQQYIAFTRRN